MTQYPNEGKKGNKQEVIFLSIDQTLVSYWERKLVKEREILINSDPHFILILCFCSMTGKLELETMRPCDLYLQFVFTQGDEIFHENLAN